MITACLLWCTALFTIERYIFVFYPHHFQKKINRYIYHYLPIGTVLFYTFLFYLLTGLLLHCELEIDFNQQSCGVPCLDQPGGIQTFQWFFNFLVPVFIIIFGSLILLMRVLYVRRKLGRNLQHQSRNHKLIIQLLGIAFMYTLLWLPVAIFSIVQSFSENELLDHITDGYLYPLTYLCTTSFPVIAVFFTAELRDRFMQRFRSNRIRNDTLIIGGFSMNQSAK